VNLTRWCWWGAGYSAFWNKAAYEGKDVDLACVMFDETGVAKETIYYGLMMGRKRTVTMQADDATGMDDALIEINLGKMDPVIKAMAFTVNTGMGFDLSGCAHPPCWNMVLLHARSSYR
jgi:stress response protein SCP2